MKDTIYRQAAIDTLENTKTAISENGERYIAKQNAIMRIDALPSAEPELIECDAVKACNEVTMNKVFSAYRYLNMLEDLKMYGYVLAKRRTE